MIPTKNTCNSGISSQTNQSRSFANGGSEGQSPSVGGLGVSPKFQFPQEWGIQGVEKMISKRSLREAKEKERFQEITLLEA